MRAVVIQLPPSAKALPVLRVSPERQAQRVQARGAEPQELRGQRAAGHSDQDQARAMSQSCQLIELRHAGSVRFPEWPDRAQE